MSEREKKLQARIDHMLDALRRIEALADGSDVTLSSIRILARGAQDPVHWNEKMDSPTPNNSTVGPPLDVDWVPKREDGST